MPHYHMSKQRGFTLLELLLVTGLAALFGVMTFLAMGDHREDQRRLATAQQMRELHRGVERLVVEKADDLRQRIASNGGNPIEISLGGELVTEGFVSPRLSGKSPFGHDYMVFVGQPGASSSGALEGVLIARGGYRDLDDPELGRISTLLGASGGAVLTSSPTSVRGVYGGYELDLADYFPGAGDLSGSLASVFFYDGRAVGSNFLHRYAVPGAPEANRMHADIDMNTHGLDDVGYVDVLWRDDDDADDPAISIREEGESGELFVIRNDGGIRKNDSSGNLAYGMTADGEIEGENLLLRAGAEVCRANTGGCGVSFGRPGNRPGVKLANRGRYLAVQAPGQGGRYGLQVENRSGSVVARVDDRGIMNLRQGLTICENDASSCGLNIGTAARMRVGNGTWVNMDALGSNTGFRVNRALRVQQDLQVCMVNQASCTLQIGNGGSFRRPANGWVELVPNTSSGGFRIAGSGTQLHAQGSLLVGRDAQFNRDVNIVRDLTVGRDLRVDRNVVVDDNLNVGGRITVGTGASAVTLSSGRVTAERGVRPQNVGVSGNNCSPNGLIGRTTSGDLISCVDGKWKLPGGKAGQALPGWPNWVNCGSSSASSARVYHLRSFDANRVEYLSCGAGKTARCGSASWHRNSTGTWRGSGGSRGDQGVCKGRSMRQLSNMGRTSDEFTGG